MNPIPQLVSLVAPGSLEADQYRGLRHTMEQVRRDRGHQVIAITSATAGDGKSLTTLNLAGALAQSPDTRVLVVDADLHRPSIAKYLGFDETDGPGLTDAIERDGCSLADVARDVGRSNLSAVPAGVCTSGPYELLNSARFQTLLTEARGSFDYVLIDTPPLVPLPDCRVIGRWGDGFLVVVTAHHTPRRALAEALDLLDPGQVIGIVFNGDDRPLAPYSGYYSYAAGTEAVSAPTSGHSSSRRTNK